MDSTALLEREAATITPSGPQAKRTLADMDISPYKPEAVDLYKAAKCKAANRGQWWRSTLLRTPLLTIFGFGILAAIAYLACIAGQSWFWVPALCGVCICGVGVVIMLVWGEVEIKTRARWTLIAYEGYGGHIPYSIQLLATQILCQIPGSSCLVVELTQGTKLLDPFLAVVIDGQMHHIAVWDESFIDVP